jgi:Lhr-like helicase
MSTVAKTSALIQREKTPWGVRLTAKPFTYSNTEMFIQADIAKPRPNRNPEIKFWFSGTATASPLCAGDVIIWREHLTAISDAARAEAAKMKEQPVVATRKMKKR